MNNFNLFGIGPMELVFILIIALVVLGPERLPQVAREMAKLMAQIREIYTELMGTLSKEFGDMEELKEIQRDLNSLRDPLKFNPPAKPSSQSGTKPAPKPAPKPAAPPSASTKNAGPLAPASAQVEPIPPNDVGEENQIAPPRLAAQPAVEPAVEPAAQYTVEPAVPTENAAGADQVPPEPATQGDGQ